MKTQNPSYYAVPGIRKAALKSMYKSLSVKDIMTIVCESYEVDPFDLKDKSREKHLVFPRHLSMYLIYKFTNLGIGKIGKLFNRDHTTVLHAKKMIENYIETNSYNKRDEIQEIINRCEYRDI